MRQVCSYNQAEGSKVVTPAFATVVTDSLAAPVGPMREFVHSDLDLLGILRRSRSLCICLQNVVHERYHLLRHSLRVLGPNIYVASQLLTCRPSFGASVISVQLIPGALLDLVVIFIYRSRCLN